MSRAIGLGPLLRDALAPVAPAVALLTQLGDTWFLLTLAVAAFLIGPGLAGLGLARGDGARLVALALAAFATTRTLKAVIDAPRPVPGPPPAPAYLPEALHGSYGWLVHTSSAALPSGHAVGATAVWGGLALLATWPARKRRLGGAAVVVALVALTRLALGLHYTVDVVAGVAVGLVVLGVLVGVRTPARALGIASATGAVGLAVVPDEESAAILGAAAGATVVWLALGTSLARARPSGRRVLVAAVPLGLVAAGSAVAIRLGDPSPPLVAVVAAVLTGVIVAAPAVLDENERRVLAQYFSR